jgi:predicted MFS family arabinose efflux permease
MDKRLLWLALGAFAGSTEGFLIGSLLPAISTDMEVTIGQAGFLVFGAAIAHGLGTPVLSALLGHADRRKVLALAELAFAACALLLALAPEFELLLVARMALALAAGVYTVTAMATAVSISPPERRGRAMGTVIAGQSLAVLIGVPLGAYFVVEFGWRSAYLVIAALAFAAAIAVALRLPVGLAGDRRTLRERFGVLRIRGVPLALLATVLFMAAAYMPTVFVAPLAMHSAGVVFGTLPLVLLANGVGAFAGSHLGGRLADALNPRRAVLFMSMAEAFVLLLFAAIPYLPEELRLVCFLLVMSLTGLVGWSFWPAQSRLLADIDPNSASLVLALNLTALNIGVALAAVIGGTVVDSFGAGSIPLIALPFAFAALLVTFAAGMTTRKSALAELTS